MIIQHSRSSLPLCRVFFSPTLRVFDLWTNALAFRQCVSHSWGQNSFECQSLPAPGKEAITDVFFAEGTISVLISSAVRITDSIFTQKFHHFSFHFICSLHHRFHLLISLYSFPGNFIPSDVSTKFHSTHEFILNIFIADIFNITDLIFWPHFSNKIYFCKAQLS